jgi:cyclopropane fatty-acyl-phospholipid synthase-like methyltransferase
LFQYWVGGTVDKRRLCLKAYAGERRILEVGCSVGNIAQAFVSFHNIEYVGVDIDPHAIACAQRSFVGNNNFRFICEDLVKFTRDVPCFDFILFCGILHHVNDSVATRLLQTVANVATDRTPIVIVDPIMPEHKDSWLVRQFIRVEQGEHVPSATALAGLLQSIRSLRLLDAAEFLVGATPFHCPHIARFGVYRLQKH